jgi:hypothetical protein
MDELLVPNDAPQPLWPVISQLRRSKRRSKSESFDVAERQMSPEMDGSKTAAVDSLQVDKPSNAQTVKLPPKSLIEKWGLREWWPRRGDHENSFLVETKQSELDVKSELKSRASESFDVVEIEISPETDGSKTAAVDSLRVNRTSSALTVELPPKSLIEKRGLRELVVRLQRIDVPKMVQYK